MPRFRTLASALVMVALAGAFVQLGLWWVVEAVSSPAAPAPAGPHLQLVTDHLDLGRISAGDELAATFVIANSGQDSLVFRPVLQECCTAGELPPAATVEPGHTGEIVVNVAWRELGTHGEQRFGFVSNDPKQTEFWLIVRGTVAPPQRHERSVLVRRASNDR